MIRIFVSYSRNDSAYLAPDSLLGYLKGLERDTVQFWWDDRLAAGDNWDEEIKAQIRRTDIALVLVSQWFLDSAYCSDTEVTGFLQECRSRGLVIFPVILSACEWDRHDWLRTRQFLPRGAETLEEHYTEPGRRKRLFHEIRQDLRAQVERIRGLREVASSHDKKAATAAEGPARTALTFGEPAAHQHLQAKHVLSGHTLPVEGLWFSRDATRLLSSSQVDDGVMWWDVASGKCLKRSSFWAHDVSCSPAGGEFAAAAGSVYLVRLADDQKVWSSTFPAFRVAFSPAGDLIAALSYHGALALFGRGEGGVHKLVSEDRGAAHGESLAFSPNGRYLAAGSDDNVIRLWRLPDAKLAWSKPFGRSVTGLQFSPDSSVVAGWDPWCVELIAVADGKRQRTLIDLDLSGYSSFALSPDWTLLARGGEDGTISLIRTTDSSIVAAVSGPAAQANVVRFSGDGRMLAAGFENGLVTLWDVR